MVKRVIIVHGWESSPEDCWFPWLKRELESRGFEVVVPNMPNPSIPIIGSWTQKLSEVVGEVNEFTYFVGHSVGCQAILRYLQTLSGKQSVGGAIFIAGWFNLIGLETEEEKLVASPWINEPLDFNKLRNIIPKSVAIFSDNDEWVPLSDKEIFEEKLCSEIIVEHDMGHFDRANKVFQLQSVLNAVLKLSS